jgi:putative ATP-dependent endonuclease of OLD family
MLFSKGVVLVEGISEQLLIPCFAEYMEKRIEDAHVAVVRVDGLTFKHFIKIYGAGVKADRLKYALETKVACVLDADPKRILKTGTKRRWQKCFPFEIDLDQTSYEYQKVSSTAISLDHNKSANVKICYINDGKGKTFEYEIAFNNPTLSLLPSDSMTPDDKNILTTLIGLYSESYDAFVADKEDEDVKNSLSFCSWTEDEKKRAKFAANYLFAVKKGDNAFGLQQRLRKNLIKQHTERVAFVIPEYIKNTIDWVS